MRCQGSKQLVDFKERGDNGVIKGRGRRLSNLSNIIVRVPLKELGTCVSTLISSPCSPTSRTSSTPLSTSAETCTTRHFYDCYLLFLYDQHHGELCTLWLETTQNLAIVPVANRAPQRSQEAPYPLARTRGVNGHITLFVMKGWTPGLLDKEK